MRALIVAMLVAGCSDPGPSTEDGGTPMLVFSTQPVDTIAGQALPNIVVHATDENGQPLASELTLVLANAPSAAVLEGTTTLPLLDGTATFDDLVVTYPGENIEMIAMTAGLQATSVPFDVSVGLPSTLDVTPDSGPADGFPSFTVTATLLAGDAPITGYPVVLSASGGGNSFTTTSGTTDANGRFSTAFGSSMAGPKTISAMAGSFTLTKDITLSTAACVPQLPGPPSKLHTNRVLSTIVEDLDGNGYLDVAAVESSAVAIIKNVGTIAQTTPVRYSTAMDAEGVAAGDFDADGTIDLVVASDDGGELRVLLNNGNGTFGAPIQIVVGGAKAVAIGLFTTDAIPDLAVRTRTEIQLLQGLGNGMFQPLSSISLGFTIASSARATLELADLDGDGRPDLVATDGRFLTTSLATSAGFALPTSIDVGNTGASSGPAIGDYDEDGKLDVVVNGRYLSGLGNGTFASPVLLNVANPSAATVVDFNEDGHLDLAMLISTFTGQPFLLRVFEGNGAGTFTERLRYAAMRGETLVAKDLDGDTHVDLVVGAGGVQFGERIQTYPGTGTGYRAPAYFGEEGRFWPITADFDGNGRLDLVSTTHLTGLVQIRRAVPGAFDPAGTLPNSPNATPIAAGDFDGDGKADVLVAGTQSLRWYRGNGDGTVQTDVTSSLGFPATAFGVQYAVATRLDGNTTLDAALMDSFEREIGIALGAGDGTFTLGPVIQLVDEPTNVFANDLDADGDSDLVVTLRLSSTIHPAVLVLRNDGGGVFTQLPTFLTGGAFHVTFADFNNDGMVDMVVPHDAGSISFLAGNGDGTFDPDIRSTAGVPVRWADANDLDGDGTLDVIALGSGAVFLRGNGDGTFAAPLHYPGGALEALGGDFDGDGRRDALALSTERGVTVISNRICE